MPCFSWVSFGEDKDKLDKKAEAFTDGLVQAYNTVHVITLKGLERDGLVTRTVFPTTPQRVDYELTNLGGTLWEAVEPLSLWARAHVSEILTSRERFDGKNGIAPRPKTAARPSA